MDRETELALEVAGWSEARSVDVARTVEVLVSSGYEVTLQVVQLLASFQGIRVRSRAHGSLDFLWIDPVRASEMVFQEWVSWYSEQVGCALVPVGYAYMDHMVVMVDSNARIFAGFDEKLIAMGDSIFDAIEYFLAAAHLRDAD